MQVQLHSLLTLPFDDGGEWLALLPSRLTLDERARGTNWTYARWDQHPSLEGLDKISAEHKDEGVWEQPASEDWRSVSREVFQVTAPVFCYNNSKISWYPDRD